MTNRNVLIITVCSVEVAPGRPCGQPPAGVDLARQRFLCSGHLRAALARAQSDELPDAAEMIEAALRIAREHQRKQRS